MEPLPLGSKVVVILAGFLFASGWWLLLDGLSHGSFTLFYSGLPLLSTIGLIILCTSSNRSIFGQGDFLSDDSNHKRGLLVLGISIVLSGFAGNLALYLIYQRDLTPNWPAILVLSGSGLVALR